MNLCNLAQPKMSIHSVKKRSNSGSLEPQPLENRKSYRQEYVELRLDHEP
jgi:hypothetical protein